MPLFLETPIWLPLQGNRIPREKITNFNKSKFNRSRNPTCFQVIMDIPPVVALTAPKNVFSKISWNWKARFYYGPKKSSIESVWQTPFWSLVMFSKRLRMNQYTVALSTFPTFLGNVCERNPSAT